MRQLAIILAALSLTGCGDIANQWSLSSAAAKVKELAPSYCKIRPHTTLDDRALAAVALATSEGLADVVKSGVDKLCSWVGEPVETKQAAD